MRSLARKNKEYINLTLLYYYYIIKYILKNNRQNVEKSVVIQQLFFPVKVINISNGLTVKNLKFVKKLMWRQIRSSIVFYHIFISAFYDKTIETH